VRTVISFNRIFYTTMMSQIILLVTLVFPLLHTLPAVGSRGGGGETLSGPGNMTVLSGDKAVMVCDKQRYFTPETPCHWLKDGWMLSSGGRHDVGDDCVLSISPVLPLDQGQYQCQVGGVRPVTSAPATLRVNTEPGQPVINTDDVLRVDRGEKMQLQCQSQGARPAADIEWWNADTGNRILSHVTNDVVKNGDTFDTISTLRMKVDTHMKVYCTAHSEAFPAVKQSNAVEISIKGEPRVETIEMREGDSVKIFCHNRVVKDVSMFKWFINSNQIFDENRDYLEITEFTKAYDKSIVKCVVTDQKGRDETVRVVELRYNSEDLPDTKKIVKTSSFNDFVKPPRKPKKEIMMNDDNIVKEDIKADDEDDDATFSKNSAKTTFICVVEKDGEGSGEPKYVWVNGKLKMNDADDASTDKKYKCRTVKNGYKKLGKMARDLKSYSKSIKKMSKFLNEFTNN